MTRLNSAGVLSNQTYISQEGDKNAIHNYDNSTLEMNPIFQTQHLHGGVHFRHPLTKLPLSNEIAN